MEEGRPTAGVTARVQRPDGTRQETFGSPVSVVELLREADASNWCVDDVLWIDGELVLSRSSMPDFLSLDDAAARGWLASIWSFKMMGR